MHNHNLIADHVFVHLNTKFSNLQTTKWKVNTYIVVLVIVSSPASQTKIRNTNNRLKTNWAKTIMPTNDLTSPQQYKGH